MSLVFVIISIVISTTLFLFIVIQTIVNKKLFAMRDLGKFLPIALTYFFLIGSVTLKNEVTFAMVLDALGASIRSIATFMFNAQLLAAVKTDALLNFAFVYAACIHVYLFFSVIIALFMKYSSNFIKKMRTVCYPEHDVLLDADEDFAYNYNKTYQRFLCWGKLNKEDFKRSNLKAPIYNAYFNKKTLIHYLKFAKNRVNFISTTKDDTMTLKRLSIFANAYSEMPHLFKKVYFYVCASNENIDLYTSVIDISEFRNHIILFSRYSNFANKFISEHPITELFTEEHLDYSKACLRDNVRLTNVFLGFGKYNQEILDQVLIHTNLFKVDSKTNKFVPYRVKTHIFDVKDIVVDQSADSNAGLLMSNSDAPHFEIIKHERINVFNQSFLKSIDEIVNENISREIKDCYAFFVSCGSDPINIETALELKDKYSHLVNKMIIYCRVKSLTSVPLYRVDNDQVKEKYRGIVFIGETSSIDNHDIIVNRSLESFAINKNIKYLQRTNAVSKSEALELWMNLPSIKRYNNSSVYINLKFKLQLMGLDFCPKNDKGISKDQFIKKYLGGIENYKEEFERLLKYDYQDYYVMSPVNNPRNLLALAEHDRWNSYFLSYGYKRMPLEQIKYDYDLANDKIIVKKDDIITKVHACICDAESLDEYHKYNATQLKKLSDKLNKEYPDKHIDLTKNPSYQSLVDTFYYDYDSVDEIYEVLEENGFSIVER